MEQGGKAQRETPPPPRCSQVPCPVVVLCLRHACDVRATEGRRKGSPSPPPNTTAPPRAGKAGREGAKSAPPPPEGNAAGWGGRGRRVRDEPHDRARRGRAPCKPRRGDHRGCGRRIEGATKGAAKQTPTPLQRDGSRASCLRRQSNGGKTTSPPPPPPTCLRPPKGGGCRKGGADSGPPSRGQSGTMGGQRGEGAGRTARPRPREASAEQAPAGGAPGEGTQRGQGDDGDHTACPTPQQKNECRDPCQCRACDVLTPEEGQRGRPPPPRPYLPHPPMKEARATGRGRGGKRDDGSGRRTPPPRTPRQGGEAVGRECGTTHTTVPKGSTRRASPNGGTAGGATAGRVG